MLTVAKVGGTTQVEEAEQRDRLLLEFLETPALTTDGEGRVRYVNRSAALSLGRSASELIGQSLPVLTPEARAINILQARLEECRSSSAPIELLGPGGERLPFRVIDVSAGARYVLLGEEEASTDQAQSLRASRDLLASIGHELSNSLTFSLTNLELALRKLDEMSSEDPSEPLLTAIGYLGKAHEGATRMRAATKKIQVATHRGPPSPGGSSLVEVLDAAIALAWNELRHWVGVSKRYLALPRVPSDGQALTRAFAELLPKAAGEFNQLGCTTLVLSVEVKNGAGLVSVSGQGGSEGHCGVTTGALEGWEGLAKRFADAGCKLEAVEEPGSSTRIYQVSFSLLAEEPSQSEPSASKAKAFRLLFIDDEPLLAETLQIAFGEDHDVLSVTTAKGAMKALAADQRFDLVLCDLMMPEQSGVVVYEYIKEHAPGLLSRFVIMTGGAFTPQTLQFLETYQGLLLEKPFSTQDIEVLVAQFQEMQKRS